MAPKTKESWTERYAHYLRTCERARVGALPYAEWFKWHNA